MEKKKIQTIDIKGKKYATVDSRVEFFREKFPAWSLKTEFPILDLDKGVCVCKVTVLDENGKAVADGYAHEWQSKPGSMVNKTSYIENAQTSAVGRALGFIGIGINGVGIATAEEVSLKVAHSDANDPAPATQKSEPQIMDDLVGDSVPFAEPTHTAGADDWLTVGAFTGIAERCNDITELQRIVNEQRNNPRIKELIPIAAARKQEILDNLQTMGA